MSSQLLLIVFSSSAWPGFYIMKPTYSHWHQRLPSTANFLYDYFESVTVIMFVKRFSSGMHWLILCSGKQKHQCEPPTVFSSSAFSLSHTVTTELGSLFCPFMKVPILWVEGTEPSVLGRFNFSRPHNRWAVLLYQHLFPSCPLPLLIFCSATLNTFLQACQQQDDHSCMLLSLSVWDIAGSVLLTGGCFILTLTLHLVWEKPVLWCLFAGLQARLPIFICALLKLCLIEMQIRYLIPSSMHTASSTFCAYILTLLCELQSVV